MIALKFDRKGAMKLVAAAPVHDVEYRDLNNGARLVRGVTEWVEQPAPTRAECKHDWILVPPGDDFCRKCGAYR